MFKTKIGRRVLVIFAGFFCPFLVNAQTAIFSLEDLPTVVNFCLKKIEQNGEVQQFIKKSEMQEETENTSLKMSFPLTENSAINSVIKKKNDEFADQFVKVSRQFEKDLKRKRIEEKNLAYEQDFQKILVNKKALYVNFSRKIKVDDQLLQTKNFSLLFDRQSGEVVPIADWFSFNVKSDNYVDFLANLLNEKLKNSGENWQISALPENFDSLILNKSGVQINLDQNAFSTENFAGNSPIILPFSAIQKNLTPRVCELLSLPQNSAKNFSFNWDYLKKLWQILRNPRIFSPIKLEFSPAQKEVKSTLEFPLEADAVDCQKEKCLALTFDDGPGKYTEKLLDILNQNEVKATFFVLGKMVEQNGEILQKIDGEGHEIGNHSWDHPDLARLDWDELNFQVKKTDEIIQKKIGKKGRHLRPPYGSLNYKVLLLAEKPIILWNVDPEDWKYRNGKRTAKYILAEAEKDDIVLTHDIRKSTVEAMDGIIKKLKAEGFKLVKISELIPDEELRPSGIYFRGRNEKIEK